MAVFGGVDKVLRRSRIVISIAVTLTVLLGGMAEGFAVGISVDSPDNTSTTNTLPDLNVTTTGTANVTYSWNGEGNISGCRECTSFNTTYGENNGSDANLTALWHFNENFGTMAYDETANGNNGILVNGSGFGTGRFGYGVKLDGVNDRVNISYSSSLDVIDNNDTFAVAVWIKMDKLASDSGTTNVILSQQDGVAGTGRSWLQVGSDNTVRSSHGGAPVLVSTSLIDSIDNWYFIVLTYNGTNLDLYINGTYDITKITWPGEDATGDYYIGSSKTGTKWFNGTIDELMFFNRNLSAAEIQELYSRALPDGQHNVTVYANDGALNSTTQSFTVDTTDPVIDNQTHNINESLVGGEAYVNLSVEVTDNVAIDTVIFNISDTNYTANSVSGTNFYEIQFTTSGIYCWNQTWANDTAGNTDINSSVGLCWEVDVLAPAVGTPEINNTADTINYDVRINATISDPEGNLDSYILEVIRPTSADYNVSMTLASGTEYERTITIDEVGNWSFKIYANDTIGNGTWSSQVQTVASSAGITVCSSGCDHTLIQAAINAASAGDTIQVQAGTYTENVDINKSVNLVGAGADVTTASAANSSDLVFEVTADNVNISGFTVTGAPNATGILLIGVTNCNISHNIVSNNWQGIYLASSNNNLLTNNNASTNNNGIYLGSSSNNTLINNTANSNGLTVWGNGIWIYSSNNTKIIGNFLSYNGPDTGGNGILLSYSNYSELINNTVFNNGDGIWIFGSIGNEVSDNNVSYNHNGISLDLSNNNTVANNTVSNNHIGIALYSSSSNILTSNTLYGNQLDVYSWSPSSNTAIVNRSITKDNLTLINLKNESMLGIDLMPNVTGTLNLTVKSSTNFSLLNVTDITPANQKSLNRFTSINVSGIDNNASGIKWVILKLYYENSDLSGINEDALKMYWYNESDDKWVRLYQDLNLTSSGGPEVYNISTNQTGNYVWANLSHFSGYALAGDVISGGGGTPSGGGGGGCSHRLSVRDYQISEAVVGGKAVLSLTIENTGCNERDITVWASSLPIGWSADNKTLDIPAGAIVVNLTLEIPASEDPGRKSITIELTPKYFTASFTEELWVGVKAAPAEERPPVTTTTPTIPPTVTTVLPTTTTTMTVPPQTTAPPIQEGAPPVGKIAVVLVVIGIIVAGAYFYRYHKRKKVE